MQVGFALLEVGSIRQKNTSNILLKNVLDTMIGATVFYMVGFGLFEDQQGGVIGFYKFAAHGFTQADYLRCIFNFSFCCTSSTIISGALAERIYLDTYFVYSILVTGFIFPIAAGWGWGGGWLHTIGFMDFSGSGLVHLLGGTSAFWGTYMLGPRLGVFGKQPVTNRNSTSKRRGRSQQ